MNNARTTTIKVAEHRGNPRIYLSGKWLTQHFAPRSKVDVDFTAGTITITPGDQRTVSGKKDGAIAVIDLNTADIAAALGDAASVTLTCRGQRIEISASRTQRMIAERHAKKGLGTGLGYFSGGGLLDTAATQAGFVMKAAVELQEKYADIHAANHPGTHHFVQSVEEVEHDKLAEEGPFEILIGGIPCEPYSTSRRSDVKNVPEAHELGDMVFWMLQAIERHNPRLVVLEEVPGFLSSGAFQILKHAMTRMGYPTVEARIINPVDYGAITGRRRAVIIATMDEAVTWPQPNPNTTRLSAYLDEVDPDSGEWFGNDHWVVKHWAKQTAKGNGFEPPKLTGDELSCPTIKKRYFNGQGDNPVVAHPSREGVYRWLRVAEVARIMGLPDGHDLGEVKTISGEIMGQGVEVGTFRQIIAAAAGTVKDATPIEAIAA